VHPRTPRTWCTYARTFGRPRSRVTARTRATLPRVRPCKILSSFAPHRLHLVYPCRERERERERRREETNVGIFLFSHSFLSFFVSLARWRICRRATHKSVARLSRRPQKQIISDGFYRGDLTAPHAPHAPCIKAAAPISAPRAHPF